MTEELTMALSDVGVADKHIYKEPYFDARHRPDQNVVHAIRSRFVATDLFSPYGHQQAGPRGSRRVPRQHGQGLTPPASAAEEG